MGVDFKTGRLADLVGVSISINQGYCSDSIGISICFAFH